MDLDGIIRNNFIETGFELGFEVSEIQELVKCTRNNMNDV